MVLKRFFDLSDRKQKEIVDAALNEFAEYGFVEASTNRIVAKANISKGALFTYFDSKADLFNYVWSLCMEYMGDPLKEPAEGKDIFDAIIDAFKNELNTSHIYPFIYRIYRYMRNQPDHPVYQPFILETNGHFDKYIDKVLASNTHYRVSQWEAIRKLIKITVDAMRSELIDGIAKGRDPQAIFDEYKELFELYRHGLCAEGAAED